MTQSPKSHRKIFIYGGIGAVVMFAFCFAIVPLYGLICKKTGINEGVFAPELNKPAAANVISNTVDEARSVTVQFTATNHMGMPWDFYPQMKSIVLHPGEKATVYFHAKNTTDHDMTAQAIPGMTPTDAISHFHKIECFCFHQQILKGHESKEMALIFQVDKDLPKEINVITLAYTLFDVTPNVTRKG